MVAALAVVSLCLPRASWLHTHGLTGVAIWLAAPARTHTTRGCPACCASPSPLVPGPHPPLPSRVLTGCLLHPGGQPPGPQGHLGHLKGDIGRQGQEGTTAARCVGKRTSTKGLLDIWWGPQAGASGRESQVCVARLSLSEGTWRLAPLRLLPCVCGALCISLLQIYHSPVFGVKPSTSAAVDAAASDTSLRALVKRTVGASRLACMWVYCVRVRVCMCVDSAVSVREIRGQRPC